MPQTHAFALAEQTNQLQLTMVFVKSSKRGDTRHGTKSRKQKHVLNNRCASIRTGATFREFPRRNRPDQQNKVLVGGENWTAKASAVNAMTEEGGEDEEVRAYV